MNINNMKNNIEIFKDVPNYEGIYQVSNLGNVKALARLSSAGRQLKEKTLKFVVGSSGYKNVSLSKNGKQKRFRVHQLVAMTFLNHVPDGTSKLVVDHDDDDKSNNNVNNLNIVTSRVNGNRKHLKSTSKYTGVVWNKNRKKWESRINIKGKGVFLGRYKNEKVASDCYEIALIYLEQGMEVDDIKKIIRNHNK